MATKAERQLVALDDAAIDMLRPLYLDALTAQMLGRDGEEEWEEFRKVFARALALSNLTARVDTLNTLAAEGIEPEVDNEPFLPEEMQQFQAAPAEGLTSEPFTEAINAFMSRIPNLRFEVEAMLPEARAQAFFVTDVESREAIISIQAKLGKTMEEIATRPEVGLRDFIDWAQEEGAANLAEARLETIYRTNTATANNAGRFQQLQQLDEFIALYRLNESRDIRTRGNPAGLYPNAGPHFQMGGFLAGTNDPIWQVIWPPNGFNCRASVSPISWTSARRMGLADENNVLDVQAVEARNGPRRGFVESGAYPDEGFSSGAAVGVAA